MGTHAHLPLAVEEQVCARLGLQPAPVSNQVVQQPPIQHTPVDYLFESQSNSKNHIQNQETQPSKKIERKNRASDKAPADDDSVAEISDVLEMENVTHRDKPPPELLMNGILGDRFLKNLIILMS